MKTTLASRDDDIMRVCLRRLRSQVDIPVLFGGIAVEGAARLNEVSGMRTGQIKGLRIDPGLGLGGRVLSEASPRFVLNYGQDGTISHEYDRAVKSEGLTSILSMPVTVASSTRGLVYLSTRNASASMGERLVQASSEAIKQLQAEIRIRDEVDRRVAYLQHEPQNAADRDALREMRAELRTIAATIDDQVLAKRIRGVGDDLLVAESTAPVLTPREVDVLSLVALGCANAEIATRLCIGVETVRSYLRNAMRKFDAHTRLEAVLAARRNGELI